MISESLYTTIIRHFSVERIIMKYREPNEDNIMKYYKNSKTNLIDLLR